MLDLHCTQLEKKYVEADINARHDRTCSSLMAIRCSIWCEHKIAHSYSTIGRQTDRQTNDNKRARFSETSINIINPSIVRRYEYNVYICCCVLVLLLFVLHFDVFVFFLPSSQPEANLEMISDFAAITVIWHYRLCS